MKRNLIIIICLLFAGQLLAIGNHVIMKERTENWLKNSSAEKQNPFSPKPSGVGNGGGRTGDEDPEGDLSVGNPIHDSLILSILLSGGYFFFLNKKKNRQVIINKKQ